MDWMEFSVLVTTHGLAVTIGTYIGRQGIALVETRLAAHEKVLVHQGAVPRMLYEPEMAEVRRRLDRLEQQKQQK